MFTITITAEETATKWISLLVSTVRTMLGEAEVPEINISLQRVKRGPRPQVMYHPVADARFHHARREFLPRRDVESRPIEAVE